LCGRSRDGNHISSSIEELNVRRWWEEKIRPYIIVMSVHASIEVLGLEVEADIIPVSWPDFVIRRRLMLY
jgi:hypothetical protein